MYIEILIQYWYNVKNKEHKVSDPTENFGKVMDDLKVFLMLSDYN